jgi:hypothetical protein
MPKCANSILDVIVIYQSAYYPIDKNSSSKSSLV